MEFSSESNRKSGGSGKKFHPEHETRARKQCLNLTFLIPKIVTLCACSILLLAKNQLTRPAYGAEINQVDSSENYFDHYLEQLSQEDANELACVRRLDSATIGHKVDWMAKKLVEATENDEKLLDSMRTALRVDEIEEVANTPKLTRQVKVKSGSRRQDNLHTLSRRSLMHALSDDPTELFTDDHRPSNKHKLTQSASWPRAHPTVVHQERKLDLDRFRQMFSENFMRLPQNDKRTWIDVSRQLMGQSLSKETTHESTWSAMQNLFTIGAQHGLTLLDHFYSTPEFVLDIPIVGKQILEMQQKSMPFYLILRILRHTHTLYKLRGAEALARHQMGDLDEIQKQIKATKRLIGHDGALMFQKIVQRLIVKSVREEEAAAAAVLGGNGLSLSQKECGIRLFYAILSFILGLESKCTPADLSLANSN